MTIAEHVTADGPDNPNYKFDGAALPFILPEIGAACRCDSAVKALMIAVMEDGIRCFLSPKEDERLEAEAWMTSGERGYVFAFLTICDALELDGRAVYESLTERRKTNGFVARRKIRTRSNPRRRGTLRPKRQRRRKNAHQAAPILPSSPEVLDPMEASAA